jgi:hypothetical protein
MSSHRIARPEDAEQGLSENDVRQHFRCRVANAPASHSSDQVIYLVSGVAVASRPSVTR